MLDYDREAASYDETRGGRARAAAAAESIAGLAPGGGTCLDVAGGTGIVSAELAARGYEVVVVDRSTGMLGLAADRLPGAVAVADASQLPVADGSVDLVVTLWLLHLLSPARAERTVREAARVLRPGGRWLTSVDKSASHGRDGSADPDRADHVVALAARAGLTAAGTASFEAPTRYGTASGSDLATFRLMAFARGSGEPQVTPPG